MLASLLVLLNFANDFGLNQRNVNLIFGHVSKRDTIDTISNPSNVPTSITLKKHWKMSVL